MKYRSHPFKATLALTTLFLLPGGAMGQDASEMATTSKRLSAPADSASASLFPQGDLNAAAQISVGLEGVQGGAAFSADAEGGDAITHDEDAVEQTAADQPDETVQSATVTDLSTMPETAVAAEETSATDSPLSGAARIKADVSRRSGSVETSTEQGPAAGSGDPARVGIGEGPAAQTLTASLAQIRPRLRPESLAQQPQPVAQSCTDPSAVRDKDIARNNAAFAADPNLCITQERVSEHGRTWHMVVISNAGRPRGPVWAVLHDNENSAFDAALYSVSRYGGKMVALETGERRSFQGQDPNRNFGASAGITGPCRDMARKPAPKFTQAISRHFSRQFPVLTLHSNDNGHVGNGGGGHISAARSSATMKGIMATNPKRGLSDEDNALLTAGLSPFEGEPAAQRLASYLGPRGINMIYEHVRPAKNDCSFSFHTLLNNLGAYYNIEVEHGHVDDQKAILDTLMGYIGVRPLY